MSLRLRIFLGMLMVVLLALASTGAVAYYHAQRQDIAYNEQRLLRKEAALSRSLEYVLAKSQGPMSENEIASLFTDRICELADVHSLVFSLYTTDGGLITTSADLNNAEIQPPIKLSQSDLDQITTGQGRSVIKFEENSHVTTQVRWQVKNGAGENVMIANARYKPRQIDEDSLSTFLKTLAPVYLILFLGAILIAYFIVQSISRPLTRLRAEMAIVDPLNKSRELAYKFDDEIGELVLQYNELLHKLRSSLEERARYEREGAWKEMAQQVAHEIKNPLTPLRLGVQQLERAWGDDAPDFDKRLARFVSTALSQITVLSTIAEDFAHLAELRRPSLEPVSLSNVIKDAAGLYGERVTLDLQDLEVQGDSKSLLRVFNNLISNAIHASDEAGTSDPVRITTREDGPNAVIEITDSGVGISSDGLQRIFEPRFTTKKHGLGLGLAMVKSMVEQLSGDVFATSKKGRGSTFTVKLLRA